MKKTIVSVFAAAFCLVACAQQAPKSIKLMEPSFDEGMTLMQALKERKSSSGFTEKEIPLQDLSNIIWASLGVNRPDGRRTSPTGSRHSKWKSWTKNKISHCVSAASPFRDAVFLYFYSAAGLIFYLRYGILSAVQSQNLYYGM